MLMNSVGCLTFMMMILSGCHSAKYQKNKGELQSFEERVFANVANFTPVFAKSSLEDRMYDLSTRFLSVIIKKVVKDDAKIWSKLQADRKTYSEAVQHLEEEYKEEIKQVDKLQTEVYTLETQNARLKESTEEFKLKYQRILDSYAKQTETINALELKLRNTEETLERKTQEYVEIEQTHSIFKEKYSRQEISIKTMEKKIVTYERKLKMFQSVRVQPETAEEFMEISLRGISRLIYNMQSTFWTKVKNYFTKLEAEFKTEITNVKKAEYSMYGKLATEQKEEFERQIGYIYKEKQEDARIISKLREERNMLKEELIKIKLQIEEYKSTIEVTSTQTTTYDIVLNVRREEDEGMREQVDFYEVLTDLAEQEESELTAETMTKKWEELKTWFSQDPPEFIRERLESTRILLDKARNPSMKSSKDAGQEAGVEYSQVQESLDQQIKMEGKELE